MLAGLLLFLSGGMQLWANNPPEDISRETPLNLFITGEDTSDVQEPPLIDDGYYSDSAYAVDDEVWRQLHQAQDYFAQGVAANQEAAWDEAQYYLENALKVLAELDIDTVEGSPEAKRYNSLLSGVVADYRLTLLSMGTLPEDASPSAFLEKFSGLGDLGDIKVEGEKVPVTYDMPITYNDKVKKSIIYFQTVARDAFERYLRRSGKYIPLMSKILIQYGIPADMVYLPLIESGFNCKAYSWARASGPWQFIASTGRLYDLERNWWYDERRDFVKSTHAAARFLKHLYEKFGSWELALAAYNGGPGRVEKAIKRQRTDNFWELDLRKQTEDYVPFYMAATIIAKQPELYGFHIDYDDPIAFDEVTINKCLDLKTVAKLTGTTVEHVRDLNPELLRNTTPPGRKNYTLRVPAGTSARFMGELPEVKSPRETDWVQHKIKRGETVSSIASKYGVSQYAVLEANNMNRHTKIIAGKTLIIPVPLDGTSAPSGEPKERRSTGDNTYIVQKGDNLTGIARSFGTSPEKLRSLNYLGSSSRIYVGQVLRLPGSPPASGGTVAVESKTQKKTVASKDNSVSKSTARDKGKPPVSAEGIYTVKKGDSLWDIARRLGTTAATLRRLNGLNRSSRIFVGQELRISGDAPRDESGESAADYLIYIVRRGDTITDIAKAFKTNVTSIMQLNNISDASKLRVGDQLKIRKN